ncbi:MAG: ion transporter [Sulfitobacter sp.]
MDQPTDTKTTPLRKKVADIVEHKIFRDFVLIVILSNAIILGLETSEIVMSRAGQLIYVLDAICLGIFVLEITLKLFVYRAKFFRDGWNIFDFLIVAISLVPVFQGLTVLRAMRILRLLRVISVSPSMRRVVEGLINALPGMGAVFLLMTILFYIGAVMATKMFGPAFPEWFGTLGRSGYSLFQIMTLESWSMGIVRPVMEVYAYAWAFFVPFILVTTFAVVNLVVGLIVNSMQDAHHADETERTAAHRDEILDRLAAIETLLGAQAKQNKS